MNDQSLHTLFQILSKIVIVIPIAAVIIALVIKFNNTQTPKQLFTPTPAPSRIQQINDNQIPQGLLTLEGPFHCLYSNKTSTSEATIYRKKVFGQKKTIALVQNYLFDSDCLYIWNTGSYTGNKTCGLATYVEAFQIVAKLQGGSIQSIISQLSQFIPSASQSGDITKLIDSCKKEDIKDINVFELPKNILFKNEDLKKISWLRPIFPNSALE